MGFIFPKSTAELITRMVSSAREEGVYMKFVIPVKGIPGEEVVIDTRSNDDVIRDQLYGTYVTIEDDPADTSQPRMSDLILYVMSHDKDSNGWMRLFSEYDCEQDGRWFLYVSNDDPTIHVYRKELSKGLIRICSIIPGQNRVVVDGDDSSIDIHIDRTIESIDWVELLDEYGLLVHDLLIDILSPIAKKRGDNR